MTEPVTARMSELTRADRIELDDGIARQDRRVRRLVTALEADDRIDAIVQEDREVILVLAPGLEADAVQAIADGSWGATRGQG